MEDEVHGQRGHVPEPVTVKVAAVHRAVQAPQPDSVLQFQAVGDAVQADRQVPVSTMVERPRVGVKSKGRGT